MENKKIKFDVHEDFKDLCVRIQTSRISKGLETSHTKVSLWRITKTITNMINNNPQLFNILSEVKI